MTSLVFKLERMPTPCGDLLLATDADGALRALDWVDHEFRMRQLLRQVLQPDSSIGLPTTKLEPFRLIRVRSPLLTESR